MTLKTYLKVMTIATLIVWGLFGFVVYNINPEKTNVLGLTLFFFSLFIALAGTFTLLGFFLRLQIMREELAFRSVSAAFRQSFMLSILIIIFLLMIKWKVFNWLNLGLLIIVMIAAEYLWSLKSQKQIVK